MQLAKEEERADRYGIRGLEHNTHFPLLKGIDTD